MNLLLVDGNNLVMRYAHAMLRDGQADATDEQALPVLRYCEAAVREIAGKVGATHAIVALDSHETWRKELFPAYKANRGPGGTGPWGRRLRDHMDEAGWAFACAEGFEGDDVIATLAERAKEAGRSVAVLSGDSDLLALAGGHVSVYGFGGKGEERHPLRLPGWICSKFGISSVAQLPAYKALVGEPGDNLPGVKGIGPVKARELLRRFWADEAGFSAELGEARCREYQLALTLATLRTGVRVRAIALHSCRVPS